MDEAVDRGERHGGVRDDHAPAVLDQVVAESAGKPTFADAGWPGAKKAEMLSDPIAAGKQRSLSSRRVRSCLIGACRQA